MADSRVPLIQLLNAFLTSNPERKLLLEGVNEDKGTKVKVTVQLGEKPEIHPAGIDDLDFCSMLWSAGMLPARGHEEMQQFVIAFLDRPGNRPKALAIDTNLVYSRFVQNFFSQQYGRPFDRVPAFIVVGRGTNDEMHYKTSVMYRGMLDERYKRFIDAIVQDPDACMLLVNARDPVEVYERMDKASSRAGRLGLKGLLYFRELQKNYPVIVSKPAHMYYTKEMTSKSHDKNVAVEYPDAVYDSIIRHEVEFIRDNTNLDILFLTADKNNDESSETEGLAHYHVRPPTRWFQLNDAGVAVINARNVARLLVELMAYSPYVKISAPGGGKRPMHVAYAWTGKLPEENLDGRIQAWDGSHVVFYYVDT
ncbi:MAG: hypothetical protein JW839_03450 [Candidatus Lokiarchaeota archaeon]|nr:hypothetical protein [Candidatus Lokiarchaeota archaeon]